MSYKTLVSLVSAQTLPNVLFIKAFKCFDNYIFISTDEMERRGKTLAIIKATGIDRFKCQSLKTTYDDYAKVIHDLKELQSRFKNPHETIVNITGGTKLMAMAVSKFFWGKTSTKIYYLPLNGKYLQEIYPVIRKITFPHPPIINLIEYFASHGFQIDGLTKLSHPWRVTHSLFTKVFNAGNAGMVNELSNAYNNHYQEIDKSYLTGGWFEQFMFSTVRRELNLPDSMIMYNLKMKEFNSPQESESDNEIDVAFIFDNQLFIIECKVYLSKMVKAFPMQKIQDPMFKIASIRNNLGLSANCIVAYGCKINFKTSQQRIGRLDQLMRLLSIRALIDLNDLRGADFISDLLNIPKI